MQQQRIKIALYTPSFPPKGGGIATIHYHLYHLLKNDFDINVFIYKDNAVEKNPTLHYKHTPEWFERWTELFLRIYFRKQIKNDNLNHTRRIFHSLFPVWKLNKTLKKFDPDIIIVPDNFVPAYALKKPKKSKLIWYSHHNYLRFKNNPFFSPGNWNDIDIARSLERKALKKADAVICPSNYMVEEYHRAYNHNVHVFMIHNYMDLAELDKIEPTHPFPEIKAKNYPFVYIPSGGSEIKGKRYTFEIVRRLIKIFDNKIAFFISDYISEDLKLELESLNFPYLFFPGALSWKNNIAIIKTCTMAISPTLCENFSAAIIEAQYLGLPVITFDIGGNKEVVINSQTGYVVPTWDMDAILNLSMQIISSPDKLKDLEKNAKNHIKSLIHKDKIYTQLQKCFDTISIP